MLQTIGESRGMTPTSIEKTLESLPSQCMPSQWEEILWRGWLWWYNTPSTCRNTTNTRASSWQMLFGGINPSNPRHQHHRKRYPVPMDAAEQQALLLGEDTTDLMDDEQDATVLQYDIFDVVASRLLVEPPRMQPEPPLPCTSPNTQSTVTRGLVEFFHVLSSQLLILLESMLSSTQTQEPHHATLYAQDMVCLGLDPQQDASFVRGLAQLYFGQDLQVVCCREFSLCMSNVFCCRNRSSNNSSNVHSGSIRLS
ncbi:hypothetical protein BDF14DRAFT_1822477 [Spinellus fusiger]|nr:hypothetical protein BDF14DRAFT_1822477 [Spinellus fusiger]